MILTITIIALSLIFILIIVTLLTAKKKQTTIPLPIRYEAEIFLNNNQDQPYSVFDVNNKYKIIRKKQDGDEQIIKELEVVEYSIQCFYESNMRLFRITVNSLDLDGLYSPKQIIKGLPEAYFEHTVILSNS
jgi:hypothetical protein